VAAFSLGAGRVSPPQELRALINCVGCQERQLLGGFFLLLVDLPLWAVYCSAEREIVELGCHFVPKPNSKQILCESPLCQLVGAVWAVFLCLLEL
jgi:hypothetical protein